MCLTVTLRSCALPATLPKVKHLNKCTVVSRSMCWWFSSGHMKKAAVSMWHSNPDQGFSSGRDILLLVGYIWTYTRILQMFESCLQWPQLLLRARGPCCKKQRKDPSPSLLTACQVFCSWHWPRPFFPGFQGWGTPVLSPLCPGNKSMESHGFIPMSNVKIFRMPGWCLRLPVLPQCRDVPQPTPVVSSEHVSVGHVHARDVSYARDAS